MCVCVCAPVVPVGGIERLTGRQSKVQGEGQRGVLDLMYKVLEE